MCTARLCFKVLETALSGISLELGPHAKLLCPIQSFLFVFLLAFAVVFHLSQLRCKVIEVTTNLHEARSMFLASATLHSAYTSI